MNIKTAWGSYSIDDALRDETISAYRCVDGPQPFTLIIHRDFAHGGEDAATYGQQQFERLAGTLSQLVILETRTIDVANSKAYSVHFRWSSSKGVIEQRQVYVTSAIAIVIFTLTASSNDATAALACLDGVLKSLSLS